MTRTADQIDLSILRALQGSPDATILSIATQTGLSRNTVRARLRGFGEHDALGPFDQRIRPSFLGFPMRAIVLVTVRQRRLDDVAHALSEIREVLAVDGLSGATDLFVQVAAREADHLYAVAGQILAIDGVKRTETGLVMRELVPFRVLHLAGKGDI